MKATLKSGMYLLCFSVLAGLMASCLGNDTNDDTYSTTDAELLSFSLSSDSVSDLAGVAFTIDQRGDSGLIYNYDSMAYQTTIKDKVIINYVSGAGTNNVLNITDGDSIWVTSGDSIDISKPLILKVFALDGKTKKVYIAKLNIHQVDPDSAQYHMVASGLPFLQTEDTKTVTFNGRYLTYSRIDNQIQLNTSSDAVNWTSEGVSGLPDNAVLRGIQSNGTQLFAYTDDGNLYTRYDLSIDQWIQINTPPSVQVKSILGYKNADQNRPEGLSMVIETEGVFTFAFMEDVDQWEYDASVSIPDDFPLYDFSNYSYELMLSQRISIFGGTSLDGLVQNAVWSTEDGLYWAKLTDGVHVFPPLEGANVFYYNDEFWLINGKSGNDFNRDIYYSENGGVTWLVKPDKNQMPEDYTLRSGASFVMAQDNKSFYIIGGKQSVVLPEIWNGFLNKMQFEH